MVPPKSPTLAYRAGLPTRSKDGCLTCKAKHLKCDETRPACLRCSQKGIQCGGYWQGIRWSFKHQPNLASHASTVQRPSSSSSRKVADRQSQNQNSAATSRQKDAAPASPPGSDVRGKSVEGPKSGPSLPNDEELRVGRSTRQDELELDNSSQLVVRRRASTSSSVPSLASGELFDKSSAFIINWFENVCPAWSGFDSSSNPIRKIATDLWGNSITVCSSLESMSAAFMASRNPSMRQPALRLMKRATDYVQMELQIVRSQPFPQAIPTSLLFSLFGLGTTICWVDPRGLGLPFFKEARQVLNRFNQQQPALSGTDVEMLEFFNKCMTYCNMLLAFVHDDDEDAGNDNLVGTSSGTSYEPSESWSPNGGDRMHEPLHPWTGVSSLSSRLFAETVRLCRRFRQYARDQYSIGPFFSVPFEDMQAERLEEKLLDLDISPDGETSDTGDDSTPSFHLALVAEAYRLASLLLLYQTFPNLVFLRLPGRVLPADDKTVLWQEWITPLSLHLVKVLHRIPPSSGSRVIQPLLYISASTGLRQQPGSNASPSSSQPTSGPGSGFLNQPQNMARYETEAMASPLPQNSENLSSYITGFMGNGNDTPSPATPSSGAADEASLDISSARHFIMQRLSILESSLPPTPVVVAKDLVTAIWRAYDNTPDDSLPVHWIDVMEANDLRSMFG